MATRRKRRSASDELVDVEEKISLLHARRQELRRQAMAEQREQENEVLCMLGRMVVDASTDRGWMALDYPEVVRRFKEVASVFEGSERTEGAVAPHIAYKDAMRAAEQFAAPYMEVPASGVQ